VISTGSLTVSPTPRVRGGGLSLLSDGADVGGTAAAKKMADTRPAGAGAPHYVAADYDYYEYIVRAVQEETTMT
jgi:hypothetical protein